MPRGGTLKRLWLRTVRIASVVLVGVATAALLCSARHAMPMEREPQMRVLLHEGPKLLVRADKAQWMQVRGLGGGVRRLRRLQLEQAGGSVVAVLDGTRRRLASSTVLTVQNDDPRGIWLDSRRYRGEFQISCRGGRLRVVNALGVETYLASVVGSEMPHHWPLAALRAQAIAARTYALRQRSRGGGWDVKATVASQVYRGVEAETASTRQAVADTRSLVLVHRDVRSRLANDAANAATRPPWFATSSAMPCTCSTAPWPPVPPVAVGWRLHLHLHLRTMFALLCSRLPW